MWFDEHELSELGPSVAKIPMRVPSLEDGKVHSRLPACPACEAPGAMTEFPVLDVVLDVCTKCSGVFLDGGEYEAIARAEGAQQPAVGDYRTAPKAARAIKGSFECPRCGESIPSSEGMVLPAGLVCGPCYYKYDEARLAADTAPHLRDAFVKDASGQFGVRGAEYASGAAGLGLGVLALASTIGGGPYCPLCGRRRPCGFH
jgi:Zn-finger nucleic acid-binding protein